MEGWVKLHRELLEKPIWKCSTYKQRALLITILLLASHKSTEWEWGCDKFTLQPGWINLNKSSNMAQFHWKQKEFERLYQVFQHKKRHPEYLAGIVELENSAKGFSDYVPKPIAINCEERKAIQEA